MSELLPTPLKLALVWTLLSGVVAYLVGRWFKHQRDQDDGEE